MFLLPSAVRILSLATLLLATIHTTLTAQNTVLHGVKDYVDNRLMVVDNPNSVPSGLLVVNKRTAAHTGENMVHEPADQSTFHSSGTPTGPLRETTWRDMLPHTAEGSYYNEFWSYHFFLQDDLHLHMTFSLANFGNLKSAVSGGKLFVSNFKGNNYHVAREYPMEQLIIDEEQGLIRLHPERDIYLQGRLPHSHRVHFSTEKHGVSYEVDLHFSDIYTGHTWGDGIFDVEGDHMGVFIHIPKSRVHGTVSINRQTIEVEGTAYMDHTFQTDLSSKVVSKAFRYIWHEHDAYRVGYYLIPRNRSAMPVIGMGLSGNSSESQLHKPVSVRVESTSRLGGNEIPEQIRIDYASGEYYTLGRTRDFQNVSFLEEIGGLRRRLLRGFLGGEIVEYVGTGTIDGLRPVNYSFQIVH